MDSLDLAKLRAQAIRRKHYHELTSLPFEDYVVNVDPEIYGKPTQKPTHLKPLVEWIEAVDRLDADHLILHAAVGHWKTETIFRAFTWWLSRHPHFRLAYMTVNQHIANGRSRTTQYLADKWGIDHGSLWNVEEWWNNSGGKVNFKGFGSKVQGCRWDVLVIDDPIGSRAEAESKTIRNRIWDSIKDDLVNRLLPGGVCLLSMARWHIDDPSARAMKEYKWKYIRLPAICDSPDDPLGRELGEPLNPQIKTREQCDEEQQKNPYGYESLWQGNPRPRGARLFNDPTYYTDLPPSYEIHHGTDAAFTAKTSADRSVDIAVAYDRKADTFYMLDIIIKQCQADSFYDPLEKQARKWPGKFHWYLGGTEKGTADLWRRINSERIRNWNQSKAIWDIEAQKEPNHRNPAAHDPGPKPPPMSFNPMIAVDNKYIRSTNLREYWNSGRFLIPQNPIFPASDMDEFLDVLNSFTGMEDAIDDHVDAAAAAVDGAMKTTRILWTS